MSMVILGLLVIFAPVCGVVAYFAISTVRATIAEVACIVASAGALGLLVFKVGPHFAEMYIGFGIELPAVTAWAIRSLQNAMDVAFYFIANVIGLSIVGGILFYLHHRQEETRENARRISLLATAAVTTLLILLASAILLPLPRLLNDLS